MRGILHRLFRRRDKRTSPAPEGAGGHAPGSEQPLPPRIPGVITLPIVRMSVEEVLAAARWLPPAQEAQVIPFPVERCR